MGAVNPITQLAEDVRKRFEDARVVLDPAEHANGSWFLDVDLEGYRVAVEWQARRGFGLTVNSPYESFGEGADEVFPGLREVRERLCTLLETRAAADREPPLTLQELRHARRTTQAQVADRLQIGQASIARLERRGNPRLSTLNEYVRAMGGRLVITAQFPDGVERKLRIGGQDAAE